jgi:hypothetical protein
VEYAGFELSKDNELNGITFNGVGNGTIVDFVQVHMSADDGVEFFGGTVNAKHLVLTQSDDDGFDFDMGYVGNVQFVLIDMAVGNEDMNGIEGDNLKSPMDAQPRSNPTLSNFTIIARGPNARMFNGVLLRRGASASMHNFIVTGDFKTGCVNFDDEETFKTGALSSGAGLTQTGLKMESSLVFCTAGNHFRQEATDPWSIAQWFTSDGRKANKTIDPMLQGWLPMENSPAVGMGVVPKLSGSFQFTAVDYAGAFSPFEDENWTAGWTVR